MRILEAKIYFEKNGYSLLQQSSGTETVFQITKKNKSELVLITNDDEKYDCLSDLDHPSILKIQIFPIALGTYAIKTKYLESTKRLDFWTVMYKCCEIIMYLNQNRIGINTLDPNAIIITENDVFLNLLYLKRNEFKLDDNITKLGDFLKQTLKSTEYRFQYTKNEIFLENFNHTTMTNIIIMYNMANFASILQNKVFRQDENILLEAIKMEASYLNEIDQHFKNKEFILKAINVNNCVFNHLNNEYRQDSSIKEASLKTGPVYDFEKVFKFKKFKEDHRTTLLYVEKGYPLYKVIEKFKEDEKIVLAAVRKNPFSIYYASEYLRDNLNFTAKIGLPYYNKLDTFKTFIEKTKPTFTAKAAKTLLYKFMKMLTLFGNNLNLENVFVNNVNIVYLHNVPTVSALPIIFSSLENQQSENCSSTKIFEIGKVLQMAFLNGTLIASEELSDLNIVCEIKRTLLGLTCNNHAEQIQTIIDCIIRFRMGTDPDNYFNNLKSTIESKCLCKNLRIVQNIIRRFPSLLRHVHESIKSLIKVPLYEISERNNDEDINLYELVKNGYPLQFHSHLFISEKYLIFESLSYDFSLRFVAEELFFDKEFLNKVIKIRPESFIYIKECDLQTVQIVKGKKTHSMSFDLDMTEEFYNEVKIKKKLRVDSSKVEKYLERKGLKVEMIGKGGFSKVFRVSKGDKVGDKVSALKIGVEDQMMMSEALSLSQFCSPLFVKVLGFHKISDLPCIEMEYISGGTLSDFARIHFISTKALRSIVIQLFEALLMMKKMNIVHGDLKPNNILIRDLETSSIAICDFGLSKNVSSVLKGNTFGGTRFYIAPELEKHSARHNFYSDLYSTGITILNLLKSIPEEEDSKVLNLIKSTSKGLISLIPEEREDAFYKFIIENAVHSNEKILVTAIPATFHEDETLVFKIFQYGGKIPLDDFSLQYLIWKNKLEKNPIIEKFSIRLPQQQMEFVEEYFDNTEMNEDFEKSNLISDGINVPNFIISEKTTNLQEEQYLSFSGLTSVHSILF